MDFHEQFERAQLMAEQRTMLNLLRKLGMLSVAYGIGAGVHVLYSLQPEWIQVVSWVVAGVLVVVGVFSYARPSTTGLLLQIVVMALVGGLKLVLAFIPGGEHYGAVIGVLGILGAIRYIVCYRRMRLVEAAVPASPEDLAALAQLSRELMAGKVDELPDVIAFQTDELTSGRTNWRSRLTDDLVVLADRDGVNLLLVSSQQFAILIDVRPTRRGRLHASIQWQGVHLEGTISRVSYQKYLTWKAELEASATKPSVSP